MAISPLPEIVPGTEWVFNKYVTCTFMLSALKAPSHPSQIKIRVLFIVVEFMVQMIVSEHVVSSVVLFSMLLPCLHRKVLV